MELNFKIPVLGFAAYSGTGKTTLIENIIPKLAQKKIKVGVVKHAHHQFDIDYPGKDSFRFRKAGAREIIVASNQRWALIHENEPPCPKDPELASLLEQFDTLQVDLVLVEGFKHIQFPRVELYREALGHPFLYRNDDNIIAIATDQPIETVRPITVIDINNYDEITSFVEQYARNFRF